MYSASGQVLPDEHAERARSGRTIAHERTDGALPSVPFGPWLRHTQAALAEQEPADVPCAECNACCRTSHVIHVRPEEKRALSRIPRRALLPAPGLPPGNLVIGHDQAGCCPLLVEGRCTIYPDRPRACRTFDCRIYAAAGIEADRDDIARQVARWRFSYPSDDDRSLHTAVAAAARHIGRHPEYFSSAATSREPLRVAVLAIAVHELFLGDGPDADQREPAPSGETVARAVVAANVKLFGDC